MEEMKRTEPGNPEMTSGNAASGQNAAPGQNQDQSQNQTDYLFHCCTSEYFSANTFALHHLTFTSADCQLIFRFSQHFLQFQ